MTMTATTHPVALSAAEARAWLEQDAAIRVLDVRTPGEFAAGHLPGSFNIPLTLLQEHVQTVADHLGEGAAVVLVCRSGVRSSTAADALARIGGEGLHVLEGGVQSWAAAGGELRQTDGPWEMERQVRLVAGGIVLTSVLASAVLPKAKWVAGGIGGGLTFAALSDTCAMGQVLSRMPWNAGSRAQLEDVLDRIGTAAGETAVTR